MKMGLPLMNFIKIIASRPNNSLFFTLPLKKSSIFIVGTDVKMQLAQSLQLKPANSHALGVSLRPVG